MNVSFYLISIFFSFLFCTFLFPQTEFLKGADISFLQQIEDNGGVYKENGTAGDPIIILKSHGINIIRIRLWNNPPEGYNNLTKLLIIAKRIKKANLKLFVDFHYSDSWADPGKQIKPTAWASIDFSALEDSIYSFTKNVLTALKSQNTFPDMIQIGNEITYGILWDDGRVGGIYDTPGQWSNFTSLLKKCVTAAEEVRGTDSMKIMIHIDSSTDSTKCKWFFDNLNSYNVGYDYIGLSYYPWFHGALDPLTSNLNFLAERYRKPIIVTETGYPWTLGWDDTTNNYIGLPSQLLPGYPATVDGQKKFLTALISIDKNIPENLGKGVLYWEPLCITTPTLGSAMENLALFDFSGNLISSISAFENINSINKETNPEFGYILQQNYPNPFNPGTTIRYSLPYTSNVRITIYNLPGQMIKEIVSGIKARGNHEINFNVSELSSGVYLYSIRAISLDGKESYTATKKMLILK